MATAGVCSNSLWNVAGRGGQWSLVTGAERRVAVDTGTGDRGQGVMRRPGGMAIGDCRLCLILLSSV